MPHQAPVEDDDPIITSYPVYLTSPNFSSRNSHPEASSETAQKLLLLQYPAHRPAETPYNACSLQKPTSLRIKPSTGLLELDIPIDTKLNYNREKGTEYALSLKQSRIIKDGGTHGLSGGFNTGPATRTLREDEDVDMQSIPAHSSLTNESTLNVQTLGGKIVKPSPGDPIYLVGSFQNNCLHLSHLDALIQVRPQLPHLDAGNELERAQGAALARAKGKDGASAALNGDVPSVAASGRPESKAVDLKLKSSGPSSSTHTSDLGTSSNTKLLRAIQQEPWQTYDWVDEDETEAQDRGRNALHLSLPPPDHHLVDTSQPSRLESAISNSEWLDLMSAPRIEHGKKGGERGLMGKVRGRERERQRRKRNEAARKERADDVTAHTHGTAKTGEGSDTVVTGSAAIEGDGASAAGDTHDDDADDGGDGEQRQAGPSDEDSSEEEGADRPPPPPPAGEDDQDFEMLDIIVPADGPGLPQVDGAVAGAGGDGASSDDDVQEFQRPLRSSAAAQGSDDGPGWDAGAKSSPAAVPARKRGRPRKKNPASTSLTYPIVVDDD